MGRRFALYEIQRGDDLAVADFWNERLADIDARIAAREADAQEIANALAEVQATAIDRLNQTFTPLIVEAQSRLNSLGASFSGESLTEATIAASGTLNINLTAESAENYVYTEYTWVKAYGSEANRMLVRTTDFDRATSLLTAEIVSAEGSGTFSHWLLRVGTPPEAGHAERTDNPHETTAAQVGAYTIAETDAAIDAAIDEIPGVDLSSRLAVANLLSEFDTTEKRGQARQNLGLKALAVADTVGHGEIATNVFSTVANFRTGAADKVLETDTVYEAAGYVTLTDAATIALDLDTGINFMVTLGGHRVLGYPTHIKVGQSGMLFISAGNWSLGFQSGYHFDQGVVPTVLGNTWLYYHCYHSTFVLIGRAFYNVQ